MGEGWIGVWRGDEGFILLSEMSWSGRRYLRVAGVLALTVIAVVMGEETSYEGA